MFDSSDSDLPKNIVLTDDGAVRYYWRNWFQASFMISLGVLSFVIGFYLLDFESPFVLDTLLCMLPIFWIPGLAVIYFGVRAGINYTELRVEGGQLLIHHRPIPWRGNKSIPTEGINNISVIDNRTYRRGVWYDVIAAAKNGDNVILISELDLKTSEAIVHEMEKILGGHRQPAVEQQISRLKEAEIKAAAKSKRYEPIFYLMLLLVGLYFLVPSLLDMKEWRDSQDWPSTVGEVVDVKIEIITTSDGADRYAPNITYQYFVNDQMYTKRRVRVSDNSSYADEASARREADRYVADPQLIVYYDPERPERAVLDRQPPDKTKMIFGGVLTGVGVILMLILIGSRISNAENTMSLSG